MFRSFVPCFAPAIKTNKMFASRNAKSLGFNLVVTRPPMLHPSWRAPHTCSGALQGCPHFDTQILSLPAEQASSMMRNLICFLFQIGNGTQSLSTHCRFIAACCQKFHVSLPKRQDLVSGAPTSFLRITSINRYHFMLLRFLIGHMWDQDQLGGPTSNKWNLLVNVKIAGKWMLLIPPTTMAS